MKKCEMLYEGKAKKVYTTEDPELYIVDYKDDATAFNGLKKGTISGKGVINNRVTNHLMKMLEGKGIHVVDLGVDVSAEQFVQAAVDNNADLICCSALLTTTMSEMKNVVELAEEKGLRDQVKIMIGGAPITQSFCDSIGADCYTADAASCADEAIKFLAG